MTRKPAFISHSPEREAEIQSRMLDVLESRFRRRFAQEVARESDSLIARYAELSFMPMQSDKHAQNMRELYRDLAFRAALTFGRRIVTQGKADVPDLEFKQDGFFGRLFQGLANAWIGLETIRRRIQSVTETTRNRLVESVRRGQREGLGVDAIARQMREGVPHMSQMRGALIARTETHGAANFAAFETAKTTGLDLEKEWVSVIDMRTRSFGESDEFDHLSMNGQRAPMDEPFLMPWAKGQPISAMYPGEASLPAGATINCRCSVVFAVKGADD